MNGPSIAEPRVRHWTRDEYHHMGKLGWFRDQRVELIEGQIVQMTPQKSVHAVGIGKVDDALRPVFGSGYWIRIQLPLIAGPRSEPEPDVAVVPGRPGDYREHPTSALLNVEVSDTTLGHDRGKAFLYASMDVLECWIVNLVEAQLEVHRDPGPDPAARHGAGYREHRVLRGSEDIAPMAAATAHIRVDQLLS